MKFPNTHKKFKLGDFVEKVGGANWRGKVVGWYSTDLTPEGYCIESAFETGSVQIYPAKALIHMITSELLKNVQSLNR